jgi:hypothetical protein
MSLRDESLTADRDEFFEATENIVGWAAKIAEDRYKNDLSLFTEAAEFYAQIKAECDLLSEAVLNPEKPKKKAGQIADSLSRLLDVLLDHPEDGFPLTKDEKLHMVALMRQIGATISNVQGPLPQSYYTDLTALRVKISRESQRQR